MFMHRLQSERKAIRTSAARAPEPGIRFTERAGRKAPNRNAPPGRPRRLTHRTARLRPGSRAQGRAKFTPRGQKCTARRFRSGAWAVIIRLPGSAKIRRNLTERSSHAIARRLHRFGIFALAAFREHRSKRMPYYHRPYFIEAPFGDVRSFFWKLSPVGVTNAAFLPYRHVGIVPVEPLPALRYVVKVDQRQLLRNPLV